MNESEPSGFHEHGDYALHLFLLVKCTDSIDKLRKTRAIEMKDDGATSSPTYGCHIMCRNCIDIEFKMSLSCPTIRSSSATLHDIELFEDRPQFNDMERKL